MTALHEVHQLAEPLARSHPEVPVLGAIKAVEVARELGARFAAGAAERDRSRILPTEQLDQLSASGLLAATVPRGSTAARTCPPRHWRRWCGSSPRATRTSPRSRTATSSTSTCCASRAPRPRRSGSSARCSAGSPVRQRAVGDPHEARARPRDHAAAHRPADRVRPGARRRVGARRHQGLLHRSALRPLDPGARPPGRRRPAPRRVGPPRRARRDGRRRLGRHRAAHHRERDACGSTRCGCPAT